MIDRPNSTAQKSSGATPYTSEHVKTTTLTYPILELLHNQVSGNSLRTRGEGLIAEPPSAESNGIDATKPSSARNRLNITDEWSTS